MARSCGDIAAIAARTALSPSVLSFSSRARAFIAAFSSAVNPSFLSVLLADCCLPFFVVVLIGLLSCVRRPREAIESLQPGARHRVSPGTRPSARCGARGVGLLAFA